MLRTRRFGNIVPLLALLALGASAVAPATGYAGTPLGERTTQVRHDVRAHANGLGPVGPVVTRGAKQLPPIELNVDSTTEDPALTLISYTFTSGAPAKFAFGNRFTLSASQAPFTLKVVVAALFTRSDNGEGFEAGEEIGITVLTDATGSGDITKALVAFNGTATIDEPGLLAFALPGAGVTVSQGDLYIIISDRSTDAEPTPLPVILPDGGGSTDPRAFVSTTPFQPTNLGGYSPATVLPNGDGNLEGNFLVRGYGDRRAAGENVSGGGQPVDTTLPTPTNLTAIGAGNAVTLSWTAPTLPIPTPDPATEMEPNDSPATAQEIDLNVQLTGSDNSDNDGAAGGFGTDDIEDWYEITITDATSLSIALDDGGQDFDLFLYDVDGPFQSDSAVGSSGNAAGDGELIEIPVIPPGTYLIGVSAFDPGLPTTNYVLTVLAAPKVTAWNVYCGNSETFEPSASNLYAVLPGSITSFTVQNSAPGSFYVVTAVVGASQSEPSNAATGSPCEGGPTITSVVVKTNGKGKVTIRGTGFVTGTTVTINGAPVDKLKVKKQGRLLKGKGLVGGANVSSVVASGQTFTVVVVAPDGGCSSFTGTAQ